MLFVVSLKYKCEISEIEKHLPAHRNYLDKGYAKGIFLASGPKVPRTGGIILAQAENIDELMLILKDDPFHKFNLIEYDITEFAPTKTCKELSTLLT